MAHSVVDHVEVGFTDGGTANGSTGHDVTLPGLGAAVAGDWDVIFVGSDTTVTAPSGFATTQTFVNNQGGYCFTRKATGGESATVRIKTNGDFSTVVLFSRNRGLNAIDTSTNAHVDSFGALSSPTPTTATLASTTDTVLVGSTNTDSAGTVPTGETWSAGYTALGTATVGTGTALGWSGHAYKSVAGTAAESPVLSWVTNNMRNRYIFVVAFTAATGTSVTINDSSGGISLGGSTEALSISSTKADSSGGVSLGGQNETASISTTKADSSGGLSLGASTETLSISSTKQDTSGGLSLGSSAETLSISSTVQDSSGGLSLGGQNETPTTGSVFLDSSGGISLGASREAVSTSSSIADSSGGLALGASAETVSIGRVVADSSGGISLGGQNETPSITGSNVTINDSSGGLSLGSSRDTVSTGSGVVQDTMVMPVLINALTCLQTEENKVPSPVAQYMIRPGATFVAMADSFADECCAGIGWVRPGPMWESDDFPNQRTEASREDAAYYAVQVELGLMRCLPTISDVAGSEDAKPTTAQWIVATQAAMDDAAALRRAICCLRDIYGEDFVIAGQISPLENEGNCAGMTTVLTLRVPACDCVE